MSIEISDLLQITLRDDEAFHIIIETLTRIGIMSKKDKTIYQSCHLLHKRGLYYLMHFKELFALDGRDTDITPNDIARRNTIAKLLEQWGLLKINDQDRIQETVPMNEIAILPFKEKCNWILKSKYQVGK